MECFAAARLAPWPFSRPLRGLCLDQDLHGHSRESPADRRAIHHSLGARRRQYADSLRPHERDSPSTAWRLANGSQKEAADKKTALTRGVSGPFSPARLVPYVG